MAEPEAPQITDAVTTTNVKVVAQAPAIAIPELCESFADDASPKSANAALPQAQSNGTSSQLIAEAINTIAAPGAVDSRSSTED